jgi:hypothetical protein
MSGAVKRNRIILLTMPVFLLVSISGCDDNSNGARADKVRASAAIQRCSGYWDIMSTSQRREFESKREFIKECRQAPYVAKCTDGTISMKIMGNCRGHGGLAIMLHFPDA